MAVAGLPTEPSPAQAVADTVGARPKPCPLMGTIPLDKPLLLFTMEGMQNKSLGILTMVVHGVLLACTGFRV